MVWWTYSAVIAAALMAAMLVLFQVGRSWGRRAKPDDDAAAQAGIGAIDGAVLGLLGLLIAFAFSGAAQRFDARRQLIIDEANCIGTAWLRIDLLPESSQPALRDRFREYLDARLAVYAKLPDLDAARATLRTCADLQDQIWDLSVSATAESKPQVPTLLLPALNQMFDVASMRTAMTIMHPPLVILVMLVAVALAAALLTGHSLASSRQLRWIHVIGFAAAISFTIAVILDLEYPRMGFIREDAADAMLVELRQSMN